MMGTQNLNNYNFNRLDAKINYSSYYDFFITSNDKDYNTEVIYSNQVMSYNDGSKLPVWIDLSAHTCSLRPTITCDSQSGSPQVILSKNYWTKAVSICDCPYTGGTNDSHSAYTICDIRLTGIDNGLLSGMTVGPTGSTSAHCITLYDTIPTGLTFSKLSYDKRFKMHQVSASTYTNNNISYTINSSTDTSGYYQELQGGFYQGFWKLYGYPYEILPTRPERGWTMETMLKLRATGSTSGSCYSTLSGQCQGQTTLNDIYTGNTGFFFYLGTRAENKFWKSFSGDSGCTSFSGNCVRTGNSGDTCNGITGYTFKVHSNCCNEKISEVGLASDDVMRFNRVGGKSKVPLMVSARTDTYSNSIGFRVTPDFKVGYRTLRFTGNCMTTGSSVNCTSGRTYECGYKVEEGYSPMICPSLILSGTCSSAWVQVDVVFDRYYEMSGCTLENLGGVNDLVRIRYDRFQRYSWDDIKRCHNEYPVFPDDAYFDFTCTGTSVTKWFKEKDFRLGDLTFYVNGRRVYKVENFEEIIPRQLNTYKQKQVGVPYNMSWGGGSQGLYENLTFSGSSGCTGNPPYQADPNDLGLLIEKNFAGTWLGGISQFMYYIEPLSPDEVYHNFMVNKDRYSLIDCDFKKDCTSNGCNQPQTLYLRDGDSLDIKATFKDVMNNLFLNTDGEYVRFNNYQQENISSVVFKKNNVIITTPFIMSPSDTLELVITKQDSSLTSIITLIGNIIK